MNQPDRGATYPRGICTLVNDNVLDQAIALVNSIRAFDEETPIALLAYTRPFQQALEVLTRLPNVFPFPGQGRADAWAEEATRAFGAGRLRAPARLKHLACWSGPFERFLYLDTDIVVFDKIVDILDHLDEVDFVHCDDQFEGGLKHCFSESALRAVTLGADIASRVFNAGMWGSHRGAFTEATLTRCLREAARNEQLLDFSQGGTAQPILNFVVLKNLGSTRNLYRHEPSAPRMWAGTPGFMVEGGRLIDPRVNRPLMFLHWAGVPIKPENPYGAVWSAWRNSNPKVKQPCAEGKVPEISVVLSVAGLHDEWHDTLAALLSQDEGAQFEVVVVDNTPDGTLSETVRGEHPHEIRLRIFHEPRAGLSHARNRGWRAARSPFIAFIDDDAIPSRDWLKRLLALFKDPGIGVEAVGGPVKAFWPTGRPGWVKPHHLEAFSVWEPEGVAGFLAHGEPVGCNMAFRKDVLARLGGFQPRLGRRPGKPTGREETNLFRRHRETGGKIYFDPALYVKHRMPARKLTRAAFRRRVFWNGVSVGTEWLLQEHRTGGARLVRACTMAREKVFRGSVLASVCPPYDSEKKDLQRHAAWGWVGYILAVLGLVL